MTFLQLINYFLALLIVCNPIGALPAMLGLTEDITEPERKKTSLTTTFTVGIILLSVTWLGTPLIDVLGIKLPAFQIAGGIVVFLLAISMLNAEKSRMKGSKEETQEAKVKEHVGITPLAMPLIAGPGAISTVIITSSLHQDFADMLLMTVAAVSVTLLMGVILYFASFLEKVLGKVGINIFTRIGGLILASNAIENIGRGIIAMFPSIP